MSDPPSSVVLWAPKVPSFPPRPRHILKWEWMHPVYTAKGQLGPQLGSSPNRPHESQALRPLRCEGLFEKKNSVGPGALRGAAARTEI